MSKPYISVMFFYPVLHCSPCFAYIYVFVPFFLVLCCLLFFVTHHFHIDHNASCLPSKILHNHCLQFLLGIDRFHCHAINTAPKKILETAKVEEAKKIKCYKRLIYKQFVQISGLSGQQFLSYLPKRFTHLCRALYGDAILVDRNCPPIWPPEINKNIWSSLFP